MQIIVGILATVSVVTLGYVAVTFINSRAKVATKVQQQILNAQDPNRRKISPLTDMIDKKTAGIPELLEQAKIVYNEQYDKCVELQMPKEQAEEILKPMANKIKQMEDALNWDPVYRIAANAGDTVIKKILSGIKEL